jgi:hypothetical protein
VSGKPKVYNPDEREALLRGAAGHWAGGAARWMLHTDCSRAEVCRLRWRDISRLERDHPLYPELYVRRCRAQEISRATGVDLGAMHVFLNYYGLPMDPATFGDRLREMIRSGGADAAGAKQGRKRDATVQTRVSWTNWRLSSSPPR